ncbi:hypothetical protein [Burkholderia gladioli]|nr:hypothetical protein [Burkholderia gladioli]
MKFWTGARDSVSAECFALLHELSLAARTAPASPVALGAKAEFTLI